jgi:hypothetical protein
VKGKYLKDMEMKKFVEKVEECYKNIHDSHDEIKNNQFHIVPSIFALSVLEAKGIITREEQEALKNYIIHGEL